MLQLLQSLLFHKSKSKVSQMPITEETKQLQSAIKEDWENRELIDKLSLALKQISDFLNRFGLHFRR
jgi:hypothetical protein